MSVEAARFPKRMSVPLWENNWSSFHVKISQP